MMGPKQEAQAALFYEFSLEDHVPQDHLLRSIARFVDLSSIRAHLSDFYSHTGHPSVDPELLIRMLLVGYCFGRIADCVSARTSCATSTSAAPTLAAPAAPPPRKVRLSASTSGTKDVARGANGSPQLRAGPRSMCMKPERR